MTIDSHGIVAWEPGAGQLGPNAVKVVVQDGRAGTAPQEFSVTVLNQDTNQPPEIISNPPAVAAVGREYRYDAVATDPDGDPVLWSLAGSQVVAERLSSTT